MPRALAKVGDRVIAETVTWKTVENNIYVGFMRLRVCISRLTDFIFYSFPAQQSSMIPFCKTPIVPPFALGKATPLTGI